ncbi:hypothetical protein JCM10450v2_008312 [Rhodotorula kratochvilovae]
MATQHDLAGKVILLTGATDGIGKAAAAHFAGRGAHLTIVGRSKDKTARVLEELRASSGNDHLDSLVCDLSRMADIRRAAQEFKAKHDRLDLLCNNAGATFKAPTLGPDGLTKALLPLLRATAGARVVSTASSMQARGDIKLDKIATDTTVSGPTAYAASKLANVLFTRELQRPCPELAVNCFEPGMVRTSFGGFGSDQGVLLNLVYRLAAAFAVSPEGGADSLVWLATAPEAATLRGEYVSKRKAVKPQKRALDADLARGLWELSEALCGNIKE